MYSVHHNPFPKAIYLTPEVHAACARGQKWLRHWEILETRGELSNPRTARVLMHLPSVF